MQAVVMDQFGEPADVLAARERPVPEPAPGEVRVRMLAAPVNPSDLMTVRGRYGQLPELPATPGYEGIGIVESSGGGLLGKLLVGRRVAVASRGRHGTWAEQTVIPAKQAFPLAADLPIEQAAMFFVNPATAYVMTRKVLNVPRGAWLLQTAAGSALGRMVIRLGKHYGFRTLNVVRREAQAEELKALGADAVVPFDPEHDDEQAFAEQVRSHSGSDGIRYAIDPVGGGTGSAVVSTLGRDARMLIYGTLASEPLIISPRHLLTQTAAIEGFWLATWMQRQSLPTRLGLAGSISKLMRAGILVSEISETFPLEKIADAVRLSEQPARGGKVLLKIANP